MDQLTRDELDMQELEEERGIRKDLDELVRILKAWLVPRRQRK